MSKLDDLKKKEKAVAISSILANMGAAFGSPDHPFSRWNQAIAEGNKAIAQSIQQKIAEEKAKKARKSGMFGKILGTVGAIVMPAAAPALGPLAGAIGGGLGSAVGQAIGGGGVDPVNVAGSALMGGLGAVEGKNILNQQQGTQLVDNATGRPYSGQAIQPIVPPGESKTGYSPVPFKNSFSDRLRAFSAGYNQAMGGGGFGPYLGMMPQTMMPQQPPWWQY